MHMHIHNNCVYIIHNRECNEFAMKTATYTSDGQRYTAEQCNPMHVIVKVALYHMA